MMADTLSLRQSRPYSIYVLALLLVAYLLNQLDRFTLAIVARQTAQELHFGDKACLLNSSISSNVKLADCQEATNERSCEAIVDSNDTHRCSWDYSGEGFQYQILAGPVFIVVYTFAGIPLGVAADLYNRKVLLGICVIFWSVCCLLSGFVRSYWQLAILRFGIGLGEAGCTPFATSLIADYFTQDVRGAALGVYNWGIYMGYSMAYALGNFVTEANIMGMSWRWAYIVAGAPGCVIGALIILTVEEPRRIANIGEAVVGAGRRKDQIKLVGRTFCRPIVLLLCLAGSVRNAAGYVWAYNTQVYYEAIGQTKTQVGEYMSWIPLVAGSFGVVFGGFVSDRLVNRLGLSGRVITIVCSLLLAAPFTAGTLFLYPPLAYISLIPAYIVGETWVSVTLAVLVEMVPSSIRTASIAVYFFIISNIAGNMPLLVTPIKQAFLKANFSLPAALRGALYILYPGEYVLAAVLFFVVFVFVRRAHQDEDETRPLIAAAQTEGAEQRDD